MCKGLVESSSSSSIFFCCSWQIRVKQKSDPIQTSTRLLLKLGEVSSQINVSEVKQLGRLADRFCIFSLLKFDLWELGIPSGLRSHTQSIAVQGSTCLENQSLEIISIVLIHSFRSHDWKMRHFKLIFKHFGWINFWLYNTVCTAVMPRCCLFVYRPARDFEQLEHPEGNLGRQLLWPFSSVS